MSAQRPRATRSEKTEEVSRLIREVALRHIAEVGVDGLSMIKVADDAKMTKSPLYRRYDDSIDLAVDVWDYRLREHLQEVLRKTIAYAASGDPESLRWLAKEMHSPSELSRALIECLAAARRYDYLLETVELDLSRELDRFLIELSHLPPDVALSHIAFVMGGLFVGDLLPSTAEEFSESFELWHSYLTNEEMWLNREMPTQVQPIPMPVPMEEDPIVGHLVSAAIRVMMRTGYEKATANRIARYANKAFSSSYTYFDSKDEMTSYAAEYVFRQSVTRSDVMFGPKDIEDFVNFTAARIRELSTESASEETRLFRVEATLAARHHARLQKTVRQLFKDSEAQVMSVITPEAQVSREVKKVWVALRASGFGHNLLGLVPTDYRKVNWMSSANAGVAFLNERAISHYVVERSQLSVP